MGFIYLLGIIVSVGLMIGPVYGQAQTETHTETIPIEGEIIGSDCPGVEDVVYSGTLKIITHTTLDPNGGFHGKTQANFVNLRGIGKTTGDEYHLRANLGSQAFASEDGSPVAVTQTITIHIRDGINEKAKLSAHLTINANGEITVVFDKVRLDCA